MSDGDRPLSGIGHCLMAFTQWASYFLMGYIYSGRLTHCTREAPKH